MTDRPPEGPLETGPSDLDPGTDSGAKQPPSRGESTASGGAPAATGDKPPQDRWRVAVAFAVPVLIVAALVAVWVGRDDEPPATGEDPLIQYCAAVLERDSIELPVASEVSTPEARDRVPALAARMVLLTERMFASAPAEIRPDLQKQINAYRDVVRSSEASGFDRAELTESVNKVAAKNVSICNLEKVEFVASQFRYRDFPDELDSGRASLRMKNEANETHQMVLFRRKPEFGGEFSKILKAGKEGEQATRIAGGRAEPGKTDYLTVELLNGDYALTCFVESGRERHWQKGEIKEFHVR